MAVEGTTGTGKGTGSGDDGPVVVLLAFEGAAPAAMVDAVEAVDPRVEVVVEPYGEPPEVRRSRGRREGAVLGAVPDLSEQQRLAFGRAEVVAAFDVPVDVRTLAPNLRWLQAIGAGTDHLFGAGLAPPVTVTNATGVAAGPIAEFVMARLLAVWKRFDRLAQLQRAHDWHASYGRRFEGSTIAVVGLGGIGTAVAERARAFGCHVLAVRRRPDAPRPDCVEEVVGPDRLHEVLARADATVVAAPATEETADLFDAAAFDAMKPGAVFCNVARGTLVDEVALLAALGRGHLRAAVLDVTRYEPLPPDSPLWDTPGVYLSAHCAVVLDDYLDVFTELFIDNLTRYLAGRPLRNVVEV